MPELRLAVRDPNGTARQAVAMRLRGASVVSGDGYDAVMFLGPTSAGDVETALAAQTHVLLVAEPCPPADVLEGFYAAARSAGVRFAAVNPDRYLPSRQLIRDQLPNRLGEPGLIRAHRWEPPSANESGLPDGLLRDLDVVRWLTGRQPDRVYAVERHPEGGGRYVQVHLGFPGGGMALLDYTNRLPPGDGYQSLTVIAASGAAYADDHQTVQLLYRGGRPQAIKTEERARQFAAVAQDFVDALDDGRELASGQAEWRAAFAVADAARRSLASGKAVFPGGEP